jgi:hypothetical protein
VANFQLYNDKVWSFPLKWVDPISQATSTTFPAGTSFSATSSLPGSLSASVFISSGIAYLKLTPLVQNSPGINVTVNATAMTSAVQAFDVVTDPATPASVMIDTADVSSSPQNVPASPGP